MNPPAPSIPFVTITHWVKSAAQCGFALEPLLQQVGLDPTQLHPDRARIDAQAVEHLMGLCVQATQRLQPDRHFPVVLGESFTFDYLPDVETFITTSATLREALPVLDWLPPLINPFMQMQVREHGPDARLVLSMQATNMQTHPSWHLIEGGLVTLCKFTRMLLGPDWQPRHISVQHAEHPASPHFTASVAMPVHFSQPLNAIWFDAQLLDRPLRGALPSLHDMAGQRVLERLAEQTARQGMGQEPALASHSLGEQLHQMLVRHPGLMGAGIDHQARQLGLHARTLQRRLKAQSLSHSQVLAQARQQLACQWLLDPRHRIDSMAEQLGFADRRNFTEAFTRWTGMSPTAWRALHASPSPDTQRKP